MDYKKLIEFLNEQDHFIKEIGIKIEHISEGFARVRMDLDERHLNANNFVNGGALYTLADFAGVCAVSSYGYRITTVTGSINYLSGVAGIDHVYGIGRVIKSGKRIIDIEVKIIDDTGKLYMQSTLTFFNLGQKLEL